MIDLEIQNNICEIGRRMYERRFVAANDGNISVKCSDGNVWTTPTGVSKGYMKPEMLVKIDMNGDVLQGTSKPSSEVKMHLRVYMENPEVMAVVHAHPPVATAFAIGRTSLDQAVFTETIVGLGIIPVAPYATPGTQQVPDSVAPYCRDYNAVLLANHGALTWGRDLLEAYFRMESLEHSALVLTYAGYSPREPKILNKIQLQELMEIRKRLGISGGGNYDQPI